MNIKKLVVVLAFAVLIVGGVMSVNSGERNAAISYFGYDSIEAYFESLKQSVRTKSTATSTKSSVASSTNSASTSKASTSTPQGTLQSIYDDLLKGAPVDSGAGGSLDYSSDRVALGSPHAVTFSTSDTALANENASNNKYHFYLARDGKVLGRIYGAKVYVSQLGGQNNLVLYWTPKTYYGLDNKSGTIAAGNGYSVVVAKHAGGSTSSKNDALVVKTREFSIQSSLPKSSLSSIPVYYDNARKFGITYKHLTSFGIIEKTTSGTRKLNADTGASIGHSGQSSAIHKNKYKYYLYRNGQRLGELVATYQKDILGNAKNLADQYYVYVKWQFPKYKDAGGATKNAPNGGMYEIVVAEQKTTGEELQVRTTPWILVDSDWTSWWAKYTN